MVADGLVTPGVRASAAMALTSFSQYIPASAPQGLVWYCTQKRSDKSATEIRLWSHKWHPIAHPHGRTTCIWVSIEWILKDVTPRLYSPEESGRSSMASSSYTDSSPEPSSVSVTSARRRFSSAISCSSCSLLTVFSEWRLLHFSRLSSSSCKVKVIFDNARSRSINHVDNEINMPLIF